MRKGPEQPLSAAQAQARASAHELSESERRVADLLARGCAIPEIAFALGVSDCRVKLHLSRLRRKLGARHRADVAHFGMVMQAAAAMQSVWERPQ